MKKFVFFMVLALGLTTACRKKGSSDGCFVKESVERLVTIDEIGIVETIIADSSLMNASGDRAWKPLNDRMIRVKNGEKCYLRMETKNGTVTNLTYRYYD